MSDIIVPLGRKVGKVEQLKLIAMLASYKYWYIHLRYMLTIEGYIALNTSYSVSRVKVKA